MKKCKITSVKSLGKQKTYNVTMDGEQHNYRVFDTNMKNSFITSNSHSCAYAFIAYQCAYLRTKYPMEFVCNMLTSEINNSDKGEKLAQYLRTAREMDIIVKNADVNLSGLEFKIKAGWHKGVKKTMECIWSPMTMLNGIGSKAVENIVKNQPFADLKDFLTKVDTRLVNSRVFTTLLENGCMDEAWNIQKDDRPRILEEYVDLKKKIDKEKKNKQKQLERISKIGDNNLFSEDVDSKEEDDGGLDYSGDKLTI